MLLAWMEDEWNEPSRTDHYLMRIAKEVVDSRPRRKGSPRPPDLDKYKIPFRFIKQETLEFSSEEVEESEEELSAEERRKIKVKSDLAKAKWLAFMTVPVEHRFK